MFIVKEIVMNIERGFKLAKNASEFSDYNKKNVHVGAVVLYKNKPIGVGWNTSRTHPYQLKYNKYRELAKNRDYICDEHEPCLHAELMALQHATRSFKGDLSKCSIFVYSEKKDGSTRLTKPCNACSKRLEELGIRNIYYTTNNGWQYERR
jgi:deoxycytidylate deaminase